MEIERKFLLSAFPQGLPLLEEARMEQGYLCADPVVRIRSKESAGKTACRLCFKGQGRLVRQETELAISEETFRELANLLKAPMVKKEYRVYALPGGASAWNAAWWTAVSITPRWSSPPWRRPSAFTPPPFLGREVTEEKGFTMAEYWETRRFPALDCGGCGRGALSLPLRGLRRAGTAPRALRHGGKGRARRAEAVLPAPGGRAGDPRGPFCGGRRHRGRLRGRGADRQLRPHAEKAGRPSWNATRWLWCTRPTAPAGCAP